MHGQSRDLSAHLSVNLLRYSAGAAASSSLAETSRPASDGAGVRLQPGEDEDRQARDDRDRDEGDREVAGVKRLRRRSRSG